MTKKHRGSSIGQLSALVGLLLCGASLANGQQVTITSPANGTLYAPGATINVTATVTGGPVIGVKVGAPDLGMSSYQFTAPYSLTEVMTCNDFATGTT